MSAGSFWRSPSIETITSPRAASIPALIARLKEVERKRTRAAPPLGARARQLGEGAVARAVVHADDLVVRPSFSSSRRARQEQADVLLSLNTE